MAITKNRSSVQKALKTVLVSCIFILFACSGMQKVYASNLNSSLAIGDYILYSGTGASNFNVNFYNFGMPNEQSVPTYAQLTATFSADSNIYGAQIGLTTGSGSLSSSTCQNGATNYPLLADELWDLTTEQLLFFDCYSLPSSDLAAWNTPQLKFVFSSGVWYIEWYFDGTWYNSYTSSGATTFDQSIAPNFVIESYDGTSTDFMYMDVHGYFLDSTSKVSTYEYAACWGTSWKGEKCIQNGIEASGYCPISPSWQSSGYAVGGVSEANSYLSITGHIRSLGSYGASYEWGIGDYGGNYYAFNDPTIASNDICNQQMA